MKVELGRQDDITSWMALVKEVRWNFPGLETRQNLKEHEKTVLRFMAEHRALCVKDHGKVIGVLLISQTHNMICCLTVSPAYRRRGIASALLQEGIQRLDRSREITVTTFRAEDKKGSAPRALYQKFGFHPKELLEELGYPVQRFILPAG